MDDLGSPSDGSAPARPAAPEPNELRRAAQAVVSGLLLGLLLALAARRARRAG